jgi:hypothetical protein
VGLLLRGPPEPPSELAHITVGDISYPRRDSDLR